MLTEPEPGKRPTFNDYLVTDEAQELDRELADLIAEDLRQHSVVITDWSEMAEHMKSHNYRPLTEAEVAAGVVSVQGIWRGYQSRLDRWMNWDARRREQQRIREWMAADPNYRIQRFIAFGARQCARNSPEEPRR